MPAFLAALGRMLAWLVGGSVAQWVAKALFGLGLGVVAHEFALPQLMAYVKSQTSGMSAFVFDSFGAVGGDVGFSMILSATVAAVTGNAVIKALKK
jgi:hypothetical protein